MVTCCAAESWPTMFKKLSDEGLMGHSDGGDVVDEVLVGGTEVGVGIGDGVFAGDSEVGACVGITDVDGEETCVSFGDGPEDPLPSFCAPQLVKSKRQAISSRTRTKGFLLK